MAQAQEVRGRCRGVGYLCPALLDSGGQDYESSAFMSWAISLVPPHPLTSLGKLKISCRIWDGVSTILWEQSLAHLMNLVWFFHLSTWVAEAAESIRKARSAWAAEAGLQTRLGLSRLTLKASSDLSVDLVSRWVLINSYIKHFLLLNWQIHLNSCRVIQMEWSNSFRTGSQESDPCNSCFVWLWC